MSQPIHMTLKRRFIPALLIALASGLLAPPTPARSQDADTPKLAPWASSKIKYRSADQEPMGVIPSKPSHLRKSPGLKFRSVGGNRPSRLLLTDYLPPVQHQGKQQSCVAWSSGYYTYTYAVAKALQLNPEQRDNLSRRFSPAFIYNLGNGGEDRGMEPAQGFDILKNKGCATFAEMPYNANDYTSQPDADALKRAERYKAIQIAHLFEGKPRYGPGPNIEGLKAYLNDTQAPFVMAISVFGDFPMKSVSSNFVYNHEGSPKASDFRGFHAITVIGYDDSLKAFRIVNSWGPKWGDKGFLWLSEDFVKEFCVEGWALVAGGPNLRDPRVSRTQWTAHFDLIPPASR